MPYIISMKEKVILTDVDGVLLDWQYSFENWMCRHGYVMDPVHKDDYLMDKKYGIDKTESKRLIRMFNESAWIRRLPPLRDAIHYVNKLHREHGYLFHAITSLSNDQYSQHLRTKNLREMFGDTVFEDYVYLDTGADKDDVLEAYRDTDCWWIEDKPENALVGRDVGLRSLLMDHSHNQGEYSGVHRVRNWKEIYNIIIGEK